MDLTAVLAPFGETPTQHELAVAESLMCLHVDADLVACRKLAAASPYRMTPQVILGLAAGDEQTRGQPADRTSRKPAFVLGQMVRLCEAGEAQALALCCLDNLSVVQALIPQLVDSPLVGHVIWSLLAESMPLARELLGRANRPFVGRQVVFDEVRRTAEAAMADHYWCGSAEELLNAALAQLDLWLEGSMSMADRDELASEQTRMTILLARSQRKRSAFVSALDTLSLLRPSSHRGHRVAALRERVLAIAQLPEAADLQLPDSISTAAEVRRQIGPALPVVEDLLEMRPMDPIGLLFRAARALADGDDVAAVPHLAWLTQNEPAEWQGTRTPEQAALLAHLAVARLRGAVSGENVDASVELLLDLLNEDRSAVSARLLTDAILALASLGSTRLRDVLRVAGDNMKRFRDAAALRDAYIGDA